MLAHRLSSRPSVVAVQPVQPRVAVISQSYKNLENINLSRLPEFARHETDTGSPEYQVARLSARVTQLSSHLQANKKDHAAKRGLQAILAQRKSLLQYLYQDNRESYNRVIKSFGIRSVVVGDVRGATRETTKVSV